jgi:oligoendopeptidase F
MNASFVFRPVIDGETQELTDPEVRMLRKHPEEEKRKEALRAMREVFSNKEHLITFGSAYQAIVKDWTSDVSLRDFSSVMEPRNLDEDLDNEVVDTLLSEVEQSYGLYQRYLKLKASQLGKEKLQHWDLHASLAKKEREVPFTQAVEKMLETYEGFDAEFHDYARKMLENGQVDVYPQKGKRGGAFAVFEKGFESYVMLNHTNRLDDVNTLIHEFGHAIHGKLLQEQAQVVYSPPLCLAETASIFSELLLGHHLQKELSQEEELQYLASMIEEAFGAIHRQTQYVLFERRVHQKIFEGEELSYEDLCRLWREEQRKMTGEMVDYDCPAEQESSWASIPHIFHTPFYCYTYAFGNLLSFSLYQKYREEGEDFKQVYKEILKAGSSEPPKELLARYGIDITKPEFFRDGLKILEDMVDQFEQLSNPKL